LLRRMQSTSSALAAVDSGDLGDFWPT